MNIRGKHRDTFIISMATQSTCNFIAFATSFHVPILSVKHKKTLRPVGDYSYDNHVHLFSGKSVMTASPLRNLKDKTIDLNDYTVKYGVQ